MLMTQEYNSPLRTNKINIKEKRKGGKKDEKDNKDGE
jgi:hypothetical protein